MIVTNTTPHEVQKMQCHKIKTVDVSLMLTEAIRRIYHNESMGTLFRDVTIDDWLYIYIILEWFTCSDMLCGLIERIFWVNGRVIEVERESESLSR